MSQEHRDLTRISHHTKIVATIGPASSDEETLEHMIRVGLNVVRFNFSHGDAAFHGENARKVREASRRVGREVAIVADLQGPKIRVGVIEGGKMELARGDKLILDAAYEGEGKNLRVGLDYRELPKDVKAGDILLLDDGLLTLKVEQVIGEEVHTIVQNPAVLKSKKGINKQGGGLTAPALTEKDYQDLKTAVAIGADYIAVSFVKSATEDPTLSRMTIVTRGNDQVLEQITKQLNKLVEVVKVIDFNNCRHVERELMLVKVRALGKDRDELLRLTEIYRGQVIDVNEKSYTIEVTGTTGKLDSFLENIAKGTILETVRTGAAGIGRGERVLRI